MKIPRVADLEGRALPLPAGAGWVAVRYVFVKDHEKGPAGPVVRATRVTG